MYKKHYNYITILILQLWALFALCCSSAYAYQRSYLNLGFELPVISTSSTLPACRVYISSNRVPGWLTTHPVQGEEAVGNCNISPMNGSGQIIELWKGPRDMGGSGATNDLIGAREGNQFAELNAAKISELQQNICLINGEPVSWRFSHNGRNTANDTLVFRTGTQKIATASTSRLGEANVAECNSGTCNVTSKVTTSPSGQTRWADYSGTFTYAGASGQAVIGFQSTSGSSTNGNFLDAVQITVKPIIEFVSASYTTPENSLVPPSIQVIVVGIIPPGGLTLAFSVNDVPPPNNAEIGLDYKVNGGTNRIFTKFIPAGDYGMGTPYTLDIPVEIINDTNKEPDERFTITLQPDPNNFYVYSASQCGASGFGTVTYTIVDDDDPQDMNLAITKSQRAGTSGTFTSSPLNVTTSNPMQYQLVVSNSGEQTVSNTALATFTDTIPANLTGLSIVSATPGNGATTCAATRTGNTINGTFSGPKNATCTVIVQGTAATSGTVINTATVSVPVGNNDIQPSNNTSSVQTTIAAATLVLNKTTTGGIGTFNYTLTNTLQNTGTVTTTIPGFSVQIDGDNNTAGIQPYVISNVGTGASSVVINESMPSGQIWELSSISCSTTSGTIVPVRAGNQITLPMTAITPGAVVTCDVLNTRLPSVKVQKISYGGTGTFSFTSTNLTGTINNINTSTTGEGVAAPVSPTALAVTNRLNNDVTITEAAPSAGFVLTDAGCTDANTATTGNIGTFGNFDFTNRRITIPVSYLITGGADITCTFINRLSPQANLIISKTNNASQVIKGQPTTYVVRVTNNGSFAVTGATLSDPAATNLTKSAIACSNASGNQCAAVPTLNNNLTVTLPKLESGEFYEIEITATVASGGTYTSVANAASITPPSGVNNSSSGCTPSGGIIRSYSGNTCTSTDTDTASTGSRGLTIRKIWTNGKQYDQATITANTTAGNINLVSIATGSSSQTDSSNNQQVVNETTVTLQEVLDVGANNYTTAIACVRATSNPVTVNDNGNGTYNIAIPASTTTGDIVCTYTNTRKTANLRLAKIWTNGKSGDVASIPATIGLANNTTAFTRTSPTNGSATATVTVYAGEVATLPAETMTTGDVDNYNVSLACAVNTGAIASTLTSSNGKASNNLTIDGADAGKTITCTYNNSRIAQQINLAKQWQNAVNSHAITATTTGGSNNPTISATANSTGNNTVSGSLVTVYAGDTVVLPSENFTNGNQNQYNSTVGCTNGSPLVSGAVGRSLLISNNTVATVCTYRNARKTVTFRIAKVWDANSIANNVASIGATTGLTNNTTAFTSTASTAGSSNTVTAYVGETITLPAEVMTTGDINNYNVNLTCSADGGTTTNSLSGTNGQAANTLVIGVGDADKAMVCTYTNTRKSATFKLSKAWGANSIANNVANIGATTGLINNTTAFTSTASTASDSNTVTVYAGETVTLPAETMSTGNLNNYNTTLSCNADGNATANTVSGTNGQASNTLAIGAGDSGKLIACTYTNTRKSATLTLAKQWQNGKSGDAISIPATTGLANNSAVLTSTANAAGNNSSTGTSVTVYAGETATLGNETFTTGSAANYNATLACSGTSGLSGNTLTIGNNDTAITCTYTNTRIAQVVISGKVFEDNSGTTGVDANAYNGTQQAGELGIAKSKVTLTNCAGTTITSTQTDANGDYSFNVPATSLSTPNFCIAQTNLDDYSSVSGSGSYNRTTDVITVPNSGAASYSNQNFGDARLLLVLTEQGQQTVIAGGVADYPHRLKASSVLTLTTLNKTASQQPANAADQPWESLIYRDSNCNGKVDAGESLLSGSLPLNFLPNQEICVVQRIRVPINASSGAEQSSQLQASYRATLADSTVIALSSNSVSDTTLVGSAGLDLQKRVRVVASCPSTAADTNPFVTTNQASNGNYLESEITYRNNSVKNLVDVSIKDSVPTGTIYQSVSCSVNPVSCVASQVNGALLWQMTGNLPPAKEGKVRFCVTVP